MKCAHCRFFNEINVWGRCHRYAPKAIEAGKKWEWPAVDAENFCGDFEMEQDTVLVGHQSTQQAHAVDAPSKVDKPTSPDGSE